MKMPVSFKFSELKQRLMLSPSSHWLGLDYHSASDILSAVFIAKEENSELMPWNAMITKGPWDSSDEGEEYSLEALSVDNLLERLPKFMQVEDFVFFEVPSSIEMDVVCKYPNDMFLSLFAHLPEEGEQLKQSALKALNSLKAQAV